MIVRRWPVNPQRTIPMETSYTAFSRATLLLLNTYYRAIRYTNSPGNSSGLKRMRIFNGLFMQGGVARPALPGVARNGEEEDSEKDECQIWVMIQDPQRADMPLAPMC
jgi:hypothetical protein